MNNHNIKIDLGTVQETLMLPLWAGTREAEKDNPIVRDTHAKNIMERIDYDFSRIKDILQIKIVSLFRFYNMIHVQL